MHNFGERKDWAQACRQLYSQDTPWLFRPFTGLFPQQHGRFTLSWRQPLPSWARQVRLWVLFFLFPSWNKAGGC